MMIDYMFNELFQGSTSSKIEDTGESIVLKVAAWGYTRDEIDLKVEGDFLTIKGNAESSFCARLDERFKLSRDIRRKGIKAKLENGVLTVELQKGTDGKDMRIQID